MAEGNWWNPWSGGDPFLIRLWKGITSQEGQPSMTTRLNQKLPSYQPPTRLSPNDMYVGGPRVNPLSTVNPGDKGYSYLEAMLGPNTPLGQLYANQNVPKVEQPILPQQPQIPNTFQIDPGMQELLNMLKGRFNQPAPKMSSLEELKKQAALQAAMQFDPQIDAIKAAIAAQQKQTDQSSILMKDLYKELAASYGPDVANSNAAYQGHIGNEGIRLNNLNADIGSEYANDQKTSDYLSNLGLAGSNSTNGAQQDLAFLNSLNQTDSNAATNALQQMSTSNANYLTQGASVARLRGVEGINRLYGDLSDFISGQNAQMSSLGTQKANSIAQLVMQMQNAERDDYEKYQDTQWGQLLQLAQLQNTINQQAQNYGLDVAKLTAQQNAPGKIPNKGRSGAASVLEQMLGPQQGIQMMDWLTQVMLTHPDFVQGQSGYGSPAGEYYKMTPNSSASTLARLGQEQGLSPQQINAVIQAMYTWYGQG